MNDHIRRHKAVYFGVIVIAVAVFAILPMWTWLAE
jgi:hypothetical protein